MSISRDEISVNRSAPDEIQDLDAHADHVLEAFATVRAF
jgi:hypothetical protein